MDVDQDRKLALISRDPRAYTGSTSDDPGDPDPNGATNIAGVYVVDASDPARPAAARVPAAPDGPHDDLHQRLPVAVDRRPGVDRQAEAAAAELDVRAAAHRHRPERPAQAAGVPAAAGRPVPPRRRHRLLARRATSTTRASPGSPATAARAATGPTAATTTRSSAADRDATPLDPIPYAGGGLPQTVDQRHGRRLRAQRRAPDRPRRAARRRPLQARRAPARHRGGLRPGRRGLQRRRACSASRR